MSWMRLILVALFAVGLGECSEMSPAARASSESRLKDRAGPSFLVHRGNDGRSQTVVCVGKVFRPGEFDDQLDSLEFRAGAKRIVPQQQVLLRHPDQSVRLVRFSLPLRLSSAKPQVLKTRLVARPAEPQSSGFEVEESAAGITVSDGVISLTITRAGALCCRDLRFAGSAHPVLKSLSLGFGHEDSELLIEENGPYRLIICQRGQVAVRDAEPGHPFERRFSLTAGSGHLSIETWIRAATMAVPVGAFEFVMELGFKPLRLRVLGDSTGLEVLESGLEVDRFGRSLNADLAQSIAEEGLLLQGARLALRVEVEDLVERGPCRLQLSDGRLSLPMCSADYRWRAGRAASRRLDISLKSGGRSQPSIASKVAVVELVGGASKSASAVWAQPVKALTTRMQAALQPEARRRSGFDWRGELNWGDWRWSRSDAGNLEYDTILGLRHAALLLEEPELLHRSRQALKHFLRVDLNAVGIPWRHGPGHVGGVEAGHMWLQGAIAEAVSDADPFMVAGILRVVEAWTQGLKRFRPEGELCRSLAWTLILATSLSRDWAEPGLEAEISEIFQAIAGAPGGAVPLFDRFKREPGDDEITYYASAWVTLGLLGEALHSAPDLSGRAGAEARWRQALLDLVPRLWDDELEYPAARFVYDESGALMRQGGRMEGEEALILALGLSRSAARGAEQAELLDLLFPYALKNLRIESKTFNGIELSQVMWLLARLATEE